MLVCAAKLTCSCQDFHSLELNCYHNKLDSQCQKQCNSRCFCRIKGFFPTFFKELQRGLNSIISQLLNTLAETNKDPPQSYSTPVVVWMNQCTIPNMKQLTWNRFRTRCYYNHDFLESLNPVGSFFWWTVCHVQSLILSTERIPKARISGRWICSNVHHYAEQVRQNPADRLKQLRHKIQGQ